MRTDVRRLHFSPASFAILSSRIRGVWPTASNALSRIPACLGIVDVGGWGVGKLKVVDVVCWKAQELGPDDDRHDV